MNIFKTAILFGAATATIFLATTAKQTAVAGTLNLGWNYAIDPSYDSLGGSQYEIYGMAVKDDLAANTIWVAISGNTPLTGINTGPYLEGMPVSNGNIGWGDLFFDFSGKGNYKAANETNSLFGIRFAPNNDSKTPGTGIYSGVKGTSVVTENAGWWNLHNHNVNGVRRKTGLDAGMGDLAWNDPYYSPYTNEASYYRPETHIPNVIASGKKVGDITMVSDAELAAAGFALGVLPEHGRQTIGFKFDKSLLPVDNYVATLILECNNDAMALIGQTEAVPEPSSILATLLGVGAIGTWRKRKQKLAV